MAASSFTVQIPSFVSIPRADFEEGIVVVSAPDLDEKETDQLREHMLGQLGPHVKNPSLVVVNFDTAVTILDEEKMREMGWVRAR